MNSFTIFTWLLTASTIFGTYLNSRQNKYGFLVWGLCNALWLSVDFTRGIYAQAALYVVFIGFNVYGWRQWGKKNITSSKAKDYLWFKFVDLADLKEFVEINQIDDFEYRPPWRDFNDFKYHLLIIPTWKVANK
jgi:nicotinamide riboside transporter PnuC